MALLFAISFEELIRSLGSFMAGTWEIPILGLIILIVSLLILGLIYNYISKSIKNQVKLQGIPPDLFNGLRFLLRILAVALIVILSIVFLNIQSEYIVLLTGIFSTAIAFGSMKAINNFISGAWIVLTRPFTIGDYVKIKGIEGIVDEITLNYTRIKHKEGHITNIPNIECLKSEITNFTISTSDYRQQIKRLKSLLMDLHLELEKHDLIEQKLIAYHIEEEINVMGWKLREIEKTQESLENIKWGIDDKKEEKDKEQKNNQPLRSKYVEKDKIVRYTFELKLPKQPKRNGEILDELCKKWQNEFEIKPEWKIMGLGARIEYLFTIMTPDPEDLCQFFDDFVKDVYVKIYSKN
ncbi:MAG: mechanosensitive ion channel [archaeon]|nr:mechanosensitive ion channel [archaeon]